jgi:ATP-binding cassette subfamily B protein
VLQARLASIAFDIGFLPDVLAFLPSLTRVLEAGPDLVVSPTPSLPTGSLGHGVVFENVSFVYPGRDDLALDDVSFEIPAGSCVALVGHNGAGKTSLVKLLLRLYDPTEGRILLDGVDLRDLDPADLRRHLGVIFQDFVRYELTAGENIAMGHIEGVGDGEEAHEALRRAGGEGLLGVLPDGLDTALGRQFGGRELSEGEWQKLALARALVRDSALLVLDEPTAALDAQSEYDLYCRFRDLTAYRTTLLVSHRLSTARLADCIVVLSGGRVVEQGSHDELVAAGGQYARFFALQAAQHLGLDPRPGT